MDTKTYEIFLIFFNYLHIIHENINTPISGGPRMFLNFILSDLEAKEEFVEIYWGAELKN